MIPIDILVYTHMEFEHEKNEESSFFSSVIKTSKLIYDRK